MAATPSRPSHGFPRLMTICPSGAKNAATASGEPEFQAAV